MKRLSWILLGVAITAIPVAFATAISFTDITEGSWFYQSVQNLKKLGVVEGYDDGTYRPTNNVNRAEMAVMLDRFTDAMRNGCIYENKFYFNGDTVYHRELQDGFCENGEIVEMEFDPVGS